MLTCTMKVLSKKKGLVQFTIEYNEKAIKKRIQAGIGSSVKLVPESSIMYAESKIVSRSTEV